MNRNGAFRYQGVAELAHETHHCRYLLLCSLNEAYASHSVVNFRDMIRPHGHKRSAAIGKANIDFCYRKTGLTRYEVDTQAFKDCTSVWARPQSCRPDRNV
jgi:hypothetical protein